MSKLKINILYSTASQVLYFLIPLLLIPKLTGTLGLSGYGKIILIQAYVGLATTLIDWSHSWSATKEIASSENKNQRELIFRAAWTSQIFLTAISISLISAYSLVIARENMEAEYVLLACLSIVGYVLFPTWMFQGIEDIKFSSILTIAQRLILLAATFVFVQTEHDVATFLFLNAITQLAIGAVSLLRIRRLGYAIELLISRDGIIGSLKVGFELFVTRISISLYTTLIPVIIASFAGTSDVAIYGLADKIRLAAQSAISPVTQTIFPRLSSLFASDTGSALRMLRISSAGLVLMSSIISAMLYGLAEPLVNYFGGDGFGESVQILKILSPLPAVIAVSNIFGVQVMIPNGMHYHFSRIIWSCSIVGIVIIFTAVMLGAASGAAWGVVFVEVLISSVMAITVIKRFKLISAL